MNIKKLIPKQAKMFNSSQERVESRRGEWDDFVDKAEGIFQNVIEEHKKQGTFYDKLHIDNNYRDYCEKKTDHGYIALRFGKHHVGIKAKEVSNDGKKSFSSIVEEGGALLYSLGIDGRVLCLLYSSESEIKTSPKGSEFYLRLYHCPTDLTDKKILKDIKEFFWYTRITSYLSRFTKMDSMKYAMMKIRSNVIQNNWRKVLVDIASIVTILGIIQLIVFLIAT